MLRKLLLRGIYRRLPAPEEPLDPLEEGELEDPPVEVEELGDEEEGGEDVGGTGQFTAKEGGGERG